MDRCTFETFCKTVEEFVESFCEQLLGLKRYSFISRQQSKFYKELKENIKEDEAVVSLDFSENYSFVVQDTIPLEQRAKSCALSLFITMREEK